MGIFFDTGVDIDTTIDVYETHKSSYSSLESSMKTDVYSPTISPQYSIVHAPQLQFNSPHGSIGGGEVAQAPAVTGTQVTSAIIPTQSTEQSDEADMGDILGGGSSSMLQNIIIIAVIGLGAILILPALFKKKRKASYSTPAGGGSVSA